MKNLSLQEYVSSHSDGILEDIAKQYSVSLKKVIEHLPNTVFVRADNFLTIWKEVQNWGEVMFLLHLNDIILEIETILPTGNHQNGYFNLKNSSGFSGHINIDHCHAIAFIERKFMTLDTASIVFLNAFGQAMFKIFVAYDKQYQMLPNQLEKFRKLKTRLSSNK